MEFNFLTNKIITVCFPAYSGGKFIINCLALSRHAVFQDKKLVEQEVKIDCNLNELYEFKLKSALNSLPNNVNDLHNWHKFEYGAGRLFFGNFTGFNLKSYVNIHTADVVKKISQDINKNLFVEAHEFKYFLIYLKLFPNTKILQLTNFCNFMITAYKLKNNKNHYSEKEIDDWLNGGYDNYLNLFSDYKIDYKISMENIFNEEKFLPEIKNLYEKLGYDDFNSDLITKYYRAYINLHR